MRDTRHVLIHGQLTQSVRAQQKLDTRRYFADTTPISPVRRLPRRRNAREPLEDRLPELRAGHVLPTLSQQRLQVLSTTKRTWPRCRHPMPATLRCSVACGPGAAVQRSWSEAASRTVAVAQP